MDQEKSTQSGSVPESGSSFKKIMGTASDVLPSALHDVIGGEESSRGTDSNSNAYALETPPKSREPSIGESSTDDDTVKHNRSQVASFIASMYDSSGEAGGVETTDSKVESASGEGQKHREGTTEGLSSKFEIVKEKVSSAVHALGENQSLDSGEEKQSGESKGLSSKLETMKEKVSSAVHDLGEKQSSGDEDSKSAESKGLSGKFDDVKERVSSAVQSAFGRKPSASEKSDSEPVASSDSSFTEIELPSGSLVSHGQEEDGSTDAASDDTTSAPKSSPSRLETFKQMLSFDSSDKPKRADPNDETSAKSAADDESEAPKLSRLERLKQMMSFDNDDEKEGRGEETEASKSSPSTLERIKQFVSFESSDKDSEGDKAKAEVGVDTNSETRTTSTSQLQTIKEVLSSDHPSDSEEDPKLKSDETVAAEYNKVDSDKNGKSTLEHLEDNIPFDNPLGLRTPSEEADNKSGDRGAKPDEEKAKDSTSRLQKIKAALSFDTSPKSGKGTKAEVGEEGSEGNKKVDGEKEATSPWEKFKDKLSFDIPLALRTNPEEYDSNAGDKEVEPDVEAEKSSSSPLKKIKKALSVDSYAATKKDSTATSNDGEDNKENGKEITNADGNADAKKANDSSKDGTTSEDKQKSKSSLDKVKEFFYLDKEEEKKTSTENDSEKDIKATTVGPVRVNPQLDLRHRGVKTEQADEEPDVRVIDVNSGDMASPQCTDGMKSLFTNAHFERPDNAVLVTNKEADYEIREYPKTKWASVQVKTLSHKEALEHGFKALHEYIQGYNEHKEKLRMTVPVLTHVEPSVGPDGRFTVSFFTSTDLEAGPEPASADVYRSEKPGMKVFVRTFGGYADDKNWVLESSKLAKTLEEQGQDFIKDSYYIAEYDHPWKVFGRTNEVWFIGQTF